MKIKINFNAEKIIKKYWDIMLFFSKHVIFTCFLICLIVLAAGAFIFYKYFILAQNVNIEDFGSAFEVKQDIYNQIKDAWEKEQDISDSADSKSYPAIFRVQPKQSPLPSPFLHISPSPKASPKVTPEPSPSPSPSPTPSPESSPSASP